VAGLRRLDAEHLRDIERVHTRFEAHWSASRRPVLARQQAELSHLIETAQTVCIAGGHVAVLLNRMRLFGLARLLRRKPVVAWSAGAMALADRVVLFHDHPPQGAGDAELFEAGLGFVHGAVFLPHAATRIALDDAGRVALLAMRFSPANCYTLDDGSLLYWHRGRLRWATESQRLTRAGGASPAGAAA
jgi:peptidase E